MSKEGEELKACEMACELHRSKNEKLKNIIVELSDALEEADIIIQKMQLSPDSEDDKAHLYRRQLIKKIDRLVACNWRLNDVFDIQN